MNPVLAATVIVLHAVDGAEVMVNPEHITVLRPSSEAQKIGPNSLVVPGVRCVIGLGGKYVSVIEECAVVRRLMEQPQPKE